MNTKKRRHHHRKIKRITIVKIILIVLVLALAGLACMYIVNRAEQERKLKMIAAEKEAVVFGKSESPQVIVIEPEAEPEAETPEGEAGQDETAAAQGNIVRAAQKPKTVTVSADGTGMFTTLKAAVDSITDASYLTPYVIEVYPGTYDTLEGFTDEEIAAAGETGFNGLVLNDGISIRGIGNRDEIVLTASLDPGKWNEDIRKSISTLNTKGEYGIENVTVRAENLGYCVHDDYSAPCSFPDTRTLRSVRFTGKELVNGPTFTTCVAGTANARNYIIEDCDFGSELLIRSGEGNTYGGTWKITRCSGNLRLEDMADGESDAYCHVYLEDCDFRVIRRTYAHPEVSPHITLEGNGGRDSIIADAKGALYRLGPVDRAPKDDSLEKGTLVRIADGSLGFEPTGRTDIACGVVIGSDDDYTYIQRGGYVSSVILGLGNLAAGDYVTVDAGMNRVIAGGDAANAVGIVCAVDSDGIAYIRLLI